MCGCTQKGARYHHQKGGGGGFCGKTLRSTCLRLFRTAFALTMSPKERQGGRGRQGESEKMVELRGIGEGPCTKLALSVEPWTISKRHKFLIVFQLQKLQYMFYYRILFRFEIRKLVALNWSDFFCPLKASSNDFPNLFVIFLA